MSKNTVSVDIPKLQSYRIERGYMSARQLDAELRRQGYAISYRLVEQRNKPGKEKRIRFEHATVISKFLEIPFEEVFHFDVAPERDPAPATTWEPKMIYMTLADLGQLSLLREDIARQKKALQVIHGNTPRTAELRTAIKTDLQHKAEQMECEYGRVKRYVDEIKDEYIRSIIKLRFLDGLPWDLVAIQCYACKETVQSKAFYYIYARSGLCVDGRKGRVSADA